MKLISFQHHGHSKVGVIKDQAILDVSSLAPNMLSLIAEGQGILDKVQAYLATTNETISLDQVKIQAPIPTPRRNLMCLGLNYAEHAAEHYSATGRETHLPQYPIIFTKATTAVNGPYDDVPYDPEVTTELDWEVELAIVIGQGGKNVAPNVAFDHIFGYTILNDMSARDLQRQHSQYFKGKSLDGTAPMGPWIVTADELPNPHELKVISRVNGVVKQDSNTSHMIFSIPQIIAHLSNGMSLLPGDIIATGTPSGVGFARQPPEFLNVGDVVECEIQGIGKIRNTITAA